MRLGRSWTLLIPMPPSRTPTTPDGAECWQEVDRIQQQLGLRTEDLARTMGFKSASAFRNRRAREEMPVPAWNNFVARYYRELDPVDDEDDKGSASGVWMKKSDWAFVKQLGGGNKSAGIREALRMVRESLRER